MEGSGFQSNYTHEIPVQKRIINERISLQLPNELINIILVYCDGLTREKCIVVCKNFSNIYNYFKNLNMKHILSRDPILYKEVRLLKFNNNELWRICSL